MLSLIGTFFVQDITDSLRREILLRDKEARDANQKATELGMRCSQLAVEVRAKTENENKYLKELSVLTSGYNLVKSRNESLCHQNQILEERIQDLERIYGCVKTLKEEKELLLRDKDALLRSLESKQQIEDALHNLREELNCVNTVIDEQRPIAAHLEMRRNALSAEVDCLQNQITESAALERTVSRELSQMRDECSRLEERMTSSRESAEALDTHIRGLQATIAELERTVAFLTKTYGEVCTAVREAEGSLRSSREALSELEMQSEDLNLEIKKKSSALMGLAERYRSLQLDSAALTVSLTQLQEQKTMLLEEMSAREASVKALGEQELVYREQGATMKQEVDALSAVIGRLCREESELKFECMAEGTRLSGLLAEQQALNGRLEELQGHVGVLEVEVGRLETERAELTREVQGKGIERDRLEEANAAAARREAETVAARARAAEVRQERMESAKSLLSEEIEKLEQNVVNLRTEADGWSDKIEVLESEFRQTQAAVDELRRMREAMDCEREGLGLEME